MSPFAAGFTISFVANGWRPFRRWPNTTVDISELRLVIDYQRQNGADRKLTLDIVDYPGEWLLDLPLLDKSYETWSQESLALSRSGPRAPVAVVDRFVAPPGTNEEKDDGPGTDLRHHPPRR